MFNVLSIIGSIFLLDQRNRCVSMTIVSISPRGDSSVTDWIPYNRCPLSHWSKYTDEEYYKESSTTTVESFNIKYLSIKY